jgi:hydroxyacylglutathione hydrolase
MIIERVISPGIAHFSYLVGSGKTAAVIDPRRDVDIYLDYAARHGVSITHIFETHRNEDYVIGSTELATLTGARIMHGHNFPFSYGEPVYEGDTFSFGNVTLSVLDTPGHTLESISLVLRDTAVSGIPIAVFTGDAVFAGDTGRTDFYGSDRTAEVSGILFDSIHEKILPLGENVILFPAHGAGSVCGTVITDHPFTTTGYERRTSPDLQLDRQGFISRKTQQNHYYPPYFKKMEEFNQRGAPVLKRLPFLTAFSPQELASSLESYQILDVRSPTSFASGHIPGSFSIWRDGVASFSGWFLDYERPVLIVDDWSQYPDEILRTLIRIGYDNVKGYIAGGFNAWSRAGLPTGVTGAWSVQQLHHHLGGEEILVLDVRDAANRRRAGAIEGSMPVYVGELPGRTGLLSRDRHLACICDTGFKGSIAASILARNGFPYVTNILGGMAAWLMAGYPVIYPGEEK